MVYLTTISSAHSFERQDGQRKIWKAAEDSGHVLNTLTQQCGETKENHEKYMTVADILPRCENRTSQTRNRLLATGSGFSD
jgi:hypothetical protein